MSVETLYMTLGVSPTADDAEIRTAYRRLAMRYHPDVSTETKDVATSRFRVIQEAYEVLSDQQKRRIYDASIQARATYAPPPSRAAASPLITILVAVRSSNIRAVGYDALGGILEVAFVNGGIYGGMARR